MGCNKINKIGAKEMHICFVLPVPLLPLSGASFSCFRQACICRERGLRVTILSPKIAIKSNLNLNGINVIDALPDKISFGAFGHLLALILSGPIILRVLKKTKPDLLHIHNPPDVIPMVVALINHFLKIPYIYQINDPGPESILSLGKLNPAKKALLFTFASLLESVVLKQISGAITVNEVLRSKMAASRRPLREKQFIVQYNIPILSNDNNQSKPINDNNFILYVGTLTTEILGLEGMIGSFAPLWRKYGTKLLIIGDGPMRSKLIQLIRNQKADEYIKLLGYIDPGQVPAYLKNAKVCVIPYRDTILTRVATPTKLFEYIMNGKAVVFPDFPGFTEIFGDKNPGMYHSADSDGVNKTIEKLLADDGLRTKTESINKQLSRNYSFNQEMNKIFDLYNIITEKKEGGGL